MGIAVSSEPFDEVLAQLKRSHKVTTKVINCFCTLYAQVKNLSAQKDEMGVEIKAALLRDKDMVAAPGDCPYMLTLTVTDPKPVTSTDWKAVAEKLGARLFGGSFETTKSWKSVVASATKTSTPESQARLNPPAMNPDYKQN